MTRTKHATLLLTILQFYSILPNTGTSHHSPRSMDPADPPPDVRDPDRLLLLGHGERWHADVQPPKAMCWSGDILRVHADHDSCVGL